MEPWKGRVAGRPREWENVHWRRFPLNLTSQSLPLELAKHDPLDRPGVAVGVCSALQRSARPSAHILIKMDLARVEGRGEQNRGSDGASKKSSTGVKKCIPKQIGSGCSP